MKNRPRQGGFALLLTLVLVVLAAAALVGLARRSVEEALQARASVEELQRRWAVTSCRATLLGQVEDLLRDAERHGESDMAADQASQRHAARSLADVRVPIQLAGIDYLLVLTDEQARLNVNNLLQQGDGTAAEAALTQFIAESGAAARQSPAINLRPVAPGKMTTPGQPPLGAYGQVFANASPEQLLGSDSALGLAQVLTCWGDGKVNLHRAPPSVIRQVCDKTLGRHGVDSLLAAREQNPSASLTELLAQTSVDDQYRANAAKLLVDRSACHGLWVIARDRLRSWYTLAVDTAGSHASEAGAGSPRSARFEFAW